MSYGWHGLTGSLRDAPTRRSRNWNLKELAIVVCTEEQGFGDLDSQVILNGLRRHLIPLLQFDRSVTVDVQLVKDT